jgi:anti-sigma factor RsiW
MTWTTNVMDCKRAGELMPLYAASDLEGARAREVASHLASCDACSRLAKEFAESRRLLVEAFATPEFGAEFYASIRGDVLSRIVREREPSSPSSLIATLFGRRFIYAASLALVAVACLFALQYFRHGAKQEINLAGQVAHEAGYKQTAPTNSQPSPSLSPQPRVSGEQLARSNSAGAGRRRIETQRDAMDRHDATRAAIATRVDRDVIAQVAPSSINGESSRGERGVNSNAHPAVESASPSAASEVSRIEIQTADPNIRIIWLASQKSAEPKTDRDQHENGDRE